LAASGVFLLKFGFLEYQFVFGLNFAAAVVLLTSAQIGMSVKTLKLDCSRTYMQSMMLTTFLGYFSTCLKLFYGAHVIGTRVLDNFKYASVFMYGVVSFML
jgi:hypothetical protein